MTSSSLYLLDTNTAAYIVNGRSKTARQTLKEVMKHSTVVLSSISEAEILFGLESRPEATKLRSVVEEFFEIIQILAWDSTAAHTYGRMRARLTASGKTLSAMDMLIAAHAAAIGATLVTRDQAFQHASAFLDVVNWATDL